MISDVVVLLILMGFLMGWREEGLIALQQLGVRRVSKGCDECIEVKGGEVKGVEGR